MMNSITIRGMFNFSPEIMKQLDKELEFPENQFEFPVEREYDDNDCSENEDGENYSETASINDALIDKLD